MGLIAASALIMSVSAFACPAGHGLKPTVTSSKATLDRKQAVDHTKHSVTVKQPAKKR